MRGIDPLNCYEKISTKLDLATTRIFVDAKFPDSNREDLKEMIENVLSAFRGKKSQSNSTICVLIN